MPLRIPVFDSAPIDLAVAADAQAPVVLARHTGPGNIVPHIHQTAVDIARAPDTQTAMVLAHNRPRVRLRPELQHLYQAAVYIAVAPNPEAPVDYLAPLPS